MRIALAQVNSTVGDVYGNAEATVEWVRKAAVAGAHVVVFPEMSMTGYPVEDLSLKELRNIVMVERTHWPDGRKITVTLREPGPPERQAVLSLVYGMNEAGFTRYFLHATFTGQIPNGPRMLSTPELVRRFLVNVPGAIGFVRQVDADTSVKTVRIDGRMPGAPNYSLTIRNDPQP